MKHLLVLSLVATLLLANEELSLDEDFLSSLEEVSEIATKTKLNIDDSPSFVTVLHHDKLQKLGIDTIYEALAQVPGVMLTREASGVPVVVFRGVSQKGEVKLMIDGVTINNSYRGSIYHFLDFPIELVERIEVVRGAGSVLYGSGAMSGVVNVITKSSSDEGRDAVFISGGTYDNYKGGALVSANLGDIKVALDAYYQNSQKYIDFTDRHLSNYSAGVKLSNENFALLARVKNSEIGNAYGVLGIPDTKKDMFYNENESIFTQLSFNHSLGNESTIEALLGFNRYTQNVQANIGAPILDAIYSEDSYYAQLDFHSKLLPANELLLGSKFESAKVKHSEFKLGGTPATPIANPNSSRDTSSIYINDKYTPFTDLDISAGLRFDDYSDFGDALSPTLGFVYRVSESFRLKALYSQAFRAPSWVELTSNQALQAETSDSFEAGVIYKNYTNSTLRLNVYKTKINDLITKDTAGKYIQSKYAKFQGSELEYIFTPLNALEINLFGSYVQAEDTNGKELPDIANILATTSLLYEFDFGLTLGSLVKYVSSSKRSVSDTRADAPSSTLFNQTFSYTFEDVRASFIIKDIFNNGTYYALPSSTKYDDFYDGGRSILVKAEWEF